MTDYLNRPGRTTPAEFEPHPPPTPDHPNARAHAVRELAMRVSAYLGVPIDVHPMTESISIRIGNSGATAWRYREAWAMLYGMAAAEHAHRIARPIARRTIPADVVLNHDEHTITFDGLPFAHEIAAEPPPIVVHGDPVGAIQLTVYAERITEVGRPVPLPVSGQPPRDRVEGGFDVRLSVTGPLSASREQQRTYATRTVIGEHLPPEARGDALAKVMRQQTSELRLALDWRPAGPGAEQTGR